MKYFFKKKLKKNIIISKLSFSFSSFLFPLLLFIIIIIILCSTNKVFLNNFFLSAFWLVTYSISKHSRDGWENVNKRKQRVHHLRVQTDKAKTDRPVHIGVSQFLLFLSHHAQAASLPELYRPTRSPAQNLSA